ncbi:hypothetical protein D3C80_1189660 [compost metagenome]
MTDNTKVLALSGQVLPGRFIDVRPVDAGLAQTAEFDHLLIDGLVGFVLDIEMPRRLIRLNRCQQLR